MELTLIKERLNEDVITVILGYLPTKHDIIEEAKEKAYKLYKGLLLSRDKAHIFKVGNVYWDSPNSIDGISYFKVSKRTKCYVWLDYYAGHLGTTDRIKKYTKQFKISNYHFRGEDCDNAFIYRNYVKRMEHLDYFIKKGLKSELKEKYGEPP